MKKFTIKKVGQKIITAFLTFILLFQFIMPIRSNAEADDIIDEIADSDIVNYIVIGIAHFISAGGDLVMGMLNNFMLEPLTNPQLKCFSMTILL